MTKLAVRILSLDGSLPRRECELATLPGRAGQFGVMAGHMNHTALLAAGDVVLEDAAGGITVVPVRGGVATVFELGEITICELLVDGFDPPRPLTPEHPPP